MLILSQYPTADDKTPSSTNQKAQLELSFEYLMSRDTLQWISIISDQVSSLSFMSVCVCMFHMFMIFICILHDVVSQSLPKRTILLYVSPRLFSGMAD